VSFITSLLSGTPIAYAAGGIAALVLIVGLIGRVSPRSRGSKPIRAKRLALVELERIDRQRTVVLIRRDSVEHLVLLGGTGDLLIETRLIDQDQGLPPQQDASPGTRPDRRSNIPHRLPPAQAPLLRRVAER
jgi:hypothetical protein